MVVGLKASKDKPFQGTVDQELRTRCCWFLALVSQPGRSGEEGSLPNRLFCHEHAISSESIWTSRQHEETVESAG
jgi:hypothetical protein